MADGRAVMPHPVSPGGALGLTAVAHAGSAAMQRSSSASAGPRFGLARSAGSHTWRSPGTRRDLAARLRRWHTVLYTVLAVGVVSAAALGVETSQDARLLWLLVVVVLGVPHGALDPLLARTHGVWTDGAGLARYLAAYVALAGAVLLAWKAAPGLSLAALLAVSAWHFGGDWAGPSWTGHLGRWRRVACGAAVVAMPCLTHAGEVARLFALLVPETDALALTELLRVIAPVALAATLLTAVTTRSASVCAELLTVSALALVLAPLTYFAIYFCALHSPRHLLRAAPRLSDVAPSAAIVTVAAITALTLGIGAGVLFALDTERLDAALVRVLFVGLFALTVPHMLLGRPYALSGRLRLPRRAWRTPRC